MLSLMFDINWLVYLVLFVVSQIVFLQTFKVIARNSKSIGALTVLVELVSVGACLILIPFDAWRWPTGSEWWMWVLLGVSFVLYAVNDRLDATTRKNLDITVDTMMHQSYRILFFPLFLLMATICWGFTPKFWWSAIIGGTIIVIANMFLIYERGTFRFNKFVLLKMLSVLFFTFAFTFQIFAVSSFNVPFFGIMSFGIPALILLSMRQATPKSVVEEVRRKEWGLILICGVAQAVFMISILILMSKNFGADKVQVNAISAVYVLLNVVFAYIFLRERSNLVRKSVIACVIVACMVLIAVQPF